MPKSWSDKRERQYEHIKDSYEDEGVSTDEAEERAARTVNKQRAEHGETKSARKGRQSR
jgi:plasmid stabilization system protein ParE